MQLLVISSILFYIIIIFQHPVYRILVNTACPLMKLLCRLREGLIYPQKERALVKKCGLLKGEADHARIRKASSQLQDYQILVEGSGQPLGIAVPLGQIALFYVRMRLNGVSC